MPLRIKKPTDSIQRTCFLLFTQAEHLQNKQICKQPECDTLTLYPTLPDPQKNTTVEPPNTRMH